MNDLDIKNKIIIFRDQQVILDNDVAVLYGVETKRVNEAVKNNPDKFPAGYILHPTDKEAAFLRSKISTLKQGRGQHTKYTPKAFTEKGLYMLATILKSPLATETTLGIIETFARIREFSRNLSELGQETDKLRQQKLLERSSTILGDLFDNHLKTSGTETTIEVNLALLKVTHTIKKEPQ